MDPVSKTPFKGPDDQKFPEDNALGANKRDSMQGLEMVKQLVLGVPTQKTSQLQGTISRNDVVPASAEAVEGEKEKVGLFARILSLLKGSKRSKTTSVSSADPASNAHKADSKGTKLWQRISQRKADRTATKEEISLAKQEAEEKITQAKVEKEACLANLKRFRGEIERLKEQIVTMEETLKEKPLLLQNLQVQNLILHGNALLKILIQIPLLMKGISKILKKNLHFKCLSLAVLINLELITCI